MFSSLLPILSCTLVLLYRRSISRRLACARWIFRGAVRSPYVRSPTRLKTALNYLRDIRGANDALQQTVMRRERRAWCWMG